MKVLGIKAILISVMRTPSLQQVVVAFIASALPFCLNGSIRFEDVTSSTDIDYSGPSFSAAWGDFDEDGAPDLYTTNHGQPSTLYLTNGAKLLNRALGIVPRAPGDVHGATWVDFDNDGDLDLMESVGGSGDNHFFINQDGLLVNNSFELGLNSPGARGRSTLWYDWDQDGLLDVLISNIENSASTVTMHKNMFSSFEDVTSQSGLGVTSAVFANINQLFTSSVTHLLVGEQGYPQEIYEVNSWPLRNLTNSTNIPRASGRISDVAIADFNGDLLPDLVEVNAKDPSDAVIVAPGALEAVFGSAEGQSIRFSADGDVKFDLRSFISASDIFIGASGNNPSSSSFQLSNQDENVWGILAELPESGNGYYVGYEPSTGKWELKSFRTGFKLSAFITSSEAIGGLETVGFSPFAPEVRIRHIRNTGGEFLDVSDETISQEVVNCPSIAAGDFDNDMDIDLYLACTGVVNGMPNYLFENLGDGTFQKVDDLGGAQSGVYGQSDVVAVADVDVDGFLDLFVANGHGSIHPQFFDNRDRLYRNLGNANHWLQLDLEGTASNRDGIGARVTISAGGVTQVRFQNGGRHALSQDFSRIHFGLAQNTVVDWLEIIWPSGTQQEFFNIAVDKVLHISESATRLNNSPVISGDPSASVMEDDLYNFVPTASDDDGDALLFAISRKPEWASFNSKTGQLSGIPGNDSVGTTTDIVISVTDQSGEPGGVASLPPFDLTVIDVNDPPIANDDRAEVLQGGSVEINVIKNDLDVDNALDPLTIHIVSSPKNGEVEVNSDGKIRYFNSVAAYSYDAFSYQVRDVSGARSNTANVSVDVSGKDSNGDGLLDIAAEALGLAVDDPSGDSDADGVSDIEEIGEDVRSPKDSDLDGQIDALERGEAANNASLVSGLVLNDGQIVEISSLADKKLSLVSIHPAVNGPDNVSFPFGIIGYVSSSDVGGSVTTRIQFHEDLPANIVAYKVDDAGLYMSLPESLWSKVGSRAIDITLTDGDPLFDLDGLQNGEIIDPIALGILVSPSTARQADVGGTGSDAGGGGGCSLKSASGSAPMLPVLLVLSFVGLWRRKLYNSN